MITIKRCNNVKDVVHIKVKKYAGYFNPESKSFAVDPHLTSFQDLQKILIEAFNLNGPFHLTYLCRDDVGDHVFLSMLTDWDLDAAFMTSSDPHLRLKLDAEPYQDGLISKIKGWEPPIANNKDSNIVKNIFQPVSNSMSQILSLNDMDKNWLGSVGDAFNKLTVGLKNTNNQGFDYFPSKPPLDDAEFRCFLDENGCLTNPEELRLRVYHGGVSPALRKVVWRMLLNIFPGELSGVERIAYTKKKTAEYNELVSSWKAVESSSNLEQLSNMVWKDARRTDRSHEYYQGSDDNPHTIQLYNIMMTYAINHPTVSYCQGMSDIASPILMVMNSEAQAYICFCGIMTRLKSNFLSDGVAMSTKFKHLGLLVEHFDKELFHYLKELQADNMYFCYRWLLLEMKREFSFENAITVLEVMWSSLPPDPPSGELPLSDKKSLHVDGKPENFCSEKKANFDSLKILNKNGDDPNKNNKENRSKRKESFSGSKKSRDQERRGSKDPSPSSTLSSFSSFDSLSEDWESLLEVIRSNKELCRLGNTDEEDYEDGEQNFTGVGFEVPKTIPKNQNSSRNRTKTSPAKKSGQYSPLKGEEEDQIIPPPEVLGCGNPFLLFLCLSLLLDARDTLLQERWEYDEMVMYFDGRARSQCPRKVVSRAVQLFTEYLRLESESTLEFPT